MLKFIRLIRTINMIKHVSKAAARGSETEYDKALAKFKRFVLGLKLNKDEANLITAALFSTPTMLSGFELDEETAEFSIDLGNVKKVSLIILSAWTEVKNPEIHKRDILKVKIVNGELTSEFIKASECSNMSRRHG